MLWVVGDVEGVYLEPLPGPGLQGCCCGQVGRREQGRQLAARRSASRARHGDRALPTYFGHLARHGASRARHEANLSRPRERPVLKG